MRFRILFLLLLPLSIYGQIMVRHVKDKQYQKLRKSIAQRMNGCADWNEQLVCIDSLLNSKTNVSPRLKSELLNQKAEILLENAVVYLDSLSAGDSNFTPYPTYKDSVLRLKLTPIQLAWKEAETTYPTNEYRIKNYEKVLLRYYQGSDEEKKEVNLLVNIGYRKKISSIMLSAGVRTSDKNLWFFAEGSIIRNEVQPGYRMNTENATLRHAGKFTETCVLSAEIKNGDNYAFTFSPARVTSFIFADPIRIGIKTSTDGSGFAWFLRPSVGISYRFFSLGYSVNVYLRKSEGSANDLHYLNFRMSLPLFKIY